MFHWTKCVGLRKGSDCYWLIGALIGQSDLLSVLLVGVLKPHQDPWLFVIVQEPLPSLLSTGCFQRHTPAVL